MIAALLRAEPRANRAVVVFLASSDLESCEDLGRQLRTLSRAGQRHAIPVIAVAPVGDSAGVKRWLRRERISVLGLVGVPDGKPVLLREGPVTPAAAVIHRDGSIERGVEHPRRSPNWRPVSFAEELGLQ